MVAGWNQHGGNDFCRGYTSTGDGPGGHARHCRKLAVVEPVLDWNADGVFLRAILAARGNHDRRGANGTALFGKTSGVFARIEIHLSRAADELLHPGLGDAGDGGHYRSLAGPRDCGGKSVADYAGQSRSCALYTG